MPYFSPARYNLSTTSCFRFQNTAVFQFQFPKHGKRFSPGRTLLHFWGSWISPACLKVGGAPAAGHASQRLSWQQCMATPTAGTHLQRDRADCVSGFKSGESKTHPIPDPAPDHRLLWRSLSRRTSRDPNLRRVDQGANPGTLCFLTLTSTGSVLHQSFSAVQPEFHTKHPDSMQPESLRDLPPCCLSATMDFARAPGCRRLPRHAAHRRFKTLQQALLRDRSRNTKLR